MNKNAKPFSVFTHTSCANCVDGDSTTDTITSDPVLAHLRAAAPVDPQTSCLGAEARGDEPFLLTGMQKRVMVWMFFPLCLSEQEPQL